MKFRTRLFLFYIIGVGLMTFFWAAYFINFEESRVRASWREHELIQAKLVAVNFTNERQLKDPRQVSQTVNRIAKVADGRITVIDTEGKVLGDSSEDYSKLPNHSDRPEIKAALSGKIGTSARFSDTLKQRLIYVAYPLKLNGKIVCVVRIAKEQSTLNRLLIRLQLVIISGIIVTAILALIFGGLVMRRLSEPILDLKRLALRISNGDLSARVRYFGEDEVAELGLAFNNMVERLTDSFAVIKDEKRKLEVILENLVDGILVIDRDLKIILANPAAQGILGLSPKNIQGRPVLEVVLNHHLMDLIQEVSITKRVFESELFLYYPNNKQIQVLLAPLKDDNGNLAGSIVVLNDLTKLRQLERVRQDFVANVSHELRTPITSVKAMTETLLGGAWQDQAMLQRYLQAIDQESDRLTNLIKDLLDLARLDANVEVSQEPFDITELIKEVQERFINIADASRFAINLPTSDLPLVDANWDQIKQVLINLLDNAFKYTSADGQVRLSAWLEKDRIKVAIADNGIGIPKEDLSRIFERFYRVDKARSRDKGGTGLGLAIVKHIVESYGGKIEVESSIHQGSVFTFSLPIQHSIN
jgi:two-component system, OmpR family, phosphate regulon sensor histidine kinase PhoR